MFPFSLSKKNTPDEFVLIFDIGSSSVGGAIVKLSETDIPKILYSVRKETITQSNLNFERLTSSTVVSLRDVCDDIKKEGLFLFNSLRSEDENIFKMFCFLSSPWNVSQAKVLNFKKSKPFVISKDFLDEVVREEENNLRNSEGIKYFDQFKDLEIIKKGITDIIIDGYHIDDPYLKEVRNAQVSLFVSLASKRIITDIRKVLSYSFPSMDIDFNSFSLAAFLGVRDIFNPERDLIFLDVGGEVTDVSIIKDDLPVEIFSYPIGKNSLIREVEKDLKTTYKGALSLLNLYKEGNTGTDTSLRIKKVLNKMERDWQMYLEQSSVNLSSEFFIPKKVFLVADADVSSIFSSFLDNKKMNFPDEFFDVISLNTEILHNFCKSDDCVDRDVFLSLCAIFCDKKFRGY